MNNFRKFLVSSDVGAFNVNKCLIDNGYGDGDFIVNIIESDNVFNAPPGYEKVFFGYKNFTLYRYDTDNKKACCSVDCEIYVVYLGKEQRRLIIKYEIETEKDKTL